MSQSAHWTPLHLFLSSHKLLLIQFSNQLGGNTFFEKPVYHPLYACNHIGCTHGYSEMEPNGS